MWDPERYLAFADHRTRPAIELLARVALEAPHEVVDLGCGPGNSTGLLAKRWPEAALTGVDSSSEMLEQARASGVRARWVHADIAGWAPEQPCDLIYSNAALHWLPDHAVLFARLLTALRPGGVLAVQMPRNFQAPSHVLLRETAGSGPWADRLGAVVRWEPVREPAWYYDLLAGRCASVDIWEAEYLQVLEGADPMLGWVRGSALRPVIEALDTPQYAAFEAAYAGRLREAYPRRSDGRTLFPFRRLFIVAVRAD